MEKDKITLIWIAIAVIIGLFFLGGLGMGGMMGFGGMVGFGMGFGFIFMLLFLGLIIWLIVTLANTPPLNEQDSLAILKRRYASGEITKKEYEEMKKEIGR
ncbi:MAG TPA: SHOCT domain-containing protein [Candidatus Nanoarchaeia archaeon]|nr:SHOCT domain-containing protein [Candidatus Nanoarchaeia archaeon]